MSPDSQKANVPFELQCLLFDVTWLTSLYKLRDLIDDALSGWDPEEKCSCGCGEDLYQLARARLEGGYEAYGSAMYDWSTGKRYCNVLEELADALVYLSSGPVE